MEKYLHSIGDDSFKFYFVSLSKIFDEYPTLKKLPNSLKVLLESNIRNCKNPKKIKDIIKTFINRDSYKKIVFIPTRVTTSDRPSVSILLDYVLLNENNENKRFPSVPYDLVINEDINEVNLGKYSFIKNVKENLENISIITPNQYSNNSVNMECLSTLITIKSVNGKNFIYPELLLSNMDKNSLGSSALGCFCFKTGVINIKKNLLAHPLTFIFPKVVGIELVGSFSLGITLFDFEKQLKNFLENKKLEGKIVEFYGSALKNISIEYRDIITTLFDELNVFCTYFSMDDTAINYIEKTRGVEALFIKEYYKSQYLYLDDDFIEFDEKFTFDISSIDILFSYSNKVDEFIPIEELPKRFLTSKNGNFIKDNDIVLVYLKSSSFNYDISLFIHLALMIKNALNLELKLNKNINCYLDLDRKTRNCLESLDLLKYFVTIGFKEIDNNDYILEERVVLDIEKFFINPLFLYYKHDKKIEKNSLIKNSLLMSPSIIFAYCLNSNINFNIKSESLINGLYLSDLWPSIVEINEKIESIKSQFYVEVYKNIFSGNESWKDIPKHEEICLKNPIFPSINPIAYFNKIENKNIDIKDGKIMALLGDNISSEMITVTGNIPIYSNASKYLNEFGLKPDEFGNFEDRENDFELMSRASLSSIYLRNKIVKPKEGGFTKDFETNEVVNIYDFAMKEKNKKTPLFIFAGENFGCGKNYEWAVKGLVLFGVKVIVAASFDSKYRQDLISFGILPLEYVDEDINSLNLHGNELISISSEKILANSKIFIKIQKYDNIRELEFKLRLDEDEVEVYKNGSIFK